MCRRKDIDTTQLLMLLAGLLYNFSKRKKLSLPHRQWLCLTVSTAGHLCILLIFFQLSFFLWIKLGLFLLFLFALIFFTLIAHICFSFLENVLYFLTCCPKLSYGSATTLITAALYSGCRLQPAKETNRFQYRPFYLKSKEKSPCCVA